MAKAKMAESNNNIKQNNNDINISEKQRKYEIRQRR
jgi:hypothetical protein